MLADRYEIHQSIGSGGMGDVYLGTDTQTGDAVAIKQLKSHVADPDVITRFRREGELLRQLNHPNIVHMLDAVEADGIHYLIIEYVEGGDLSSLINGAMEVDQVLTIAIQVADALTRAHFLDVIHRDLKPANILLSADGTPKLTDFGIARMINEEDSVTKTGAVIGTFAYLSPEAYMGKPLDARADIWAFGVILYEMLVGKRPFDAPSTSGMIHNILNRSFPDLQEIRPDIPDTLNDLIYRMLEKSADARIPSVRLVGAEIEAMIKGQERVSMPQALSRTSSDESVFITPAPTPGRPQHNLPAQTTAFVGRDQELAELERLIASERKRLVTVMAPGGMGKTRLAIEYGLEQLENFRQGVLFVPLDKQDDPESIPMAIASAANHKLLGEGTPREQVLNYLSNKVLLLILDNYEHLIEGAGLVTEILEAAPDVTVLATSRERLNLNGENLLVMGGMEVPEWETPADALRYSAVQLFLQSARRIQVDFEMTVDNMNYIARVCRLVGGMPLGILQAAAWVDVLSVAEIAEEIQNSIDFLESEQRDLPERQRSMRAVFDYSWRLLTEDEREGLARMSVFRGGCTRQAAQSISGASVRLLTNLVNKSLLRRDQESGRFEMHVLMQQFAEEHLAAVGAADEIRNKHAVYYLSAVADQKADLQGRDQVAATEAIQSDFENVQAAWQLAVSQGLDDLLLAAIEPTFIYCGIHSRLADSLAMIRLLREKMQGEGSALAVLAAAQYASLTYQLHGYDPLLLEGMEAALASAESLGDPAILAHAQTFMGNALSNAKRHAEGLPYLEESLRYYESAGDMYHQAIVLHFMGYAYQYLDEEDKAKEINRRCLECRRKVGDLYGIAAILNNLDENHEEAYLIRKQLGDKRGVAWSGVTIALEAIERGEIEKAQPLIDEALQIIDEINYPQATMWVLVVYFYSLVLQERYDDLLPVADRMEKLPINRPDMLVNIPAVRCFHALGTGNYQQSKVYLKEILAFGTFSKIHIFGGFFAAFLLEQEGNAELALTLCTAAFEVWSAFKVLPLANRMLDRIRETLPDEAYQAAVERAQTLTSEEIFAIYEEHGFL